LQQLITLKDIRVCYWTNDRGSAEIDFLLDDGRTAIPLEVKAELNLQAKSLRTFRDKYSPAVSIRASMADYRADDWVVNLPLYAIEFIEAALSSRA
jgi:predicted AAA+ superfamily ATPase